MGSVNHHLPADINQEDLEKVIRDLNADKTVSGILVQLPLPPHLNEERVLQIISIEKDVDGFSPINIGRLAQKGREPLFVPCTPYGCIYLLEQSGVKIEGALTADTKVTWSPVVGAVGYEVWWRDTTTPQWTQHRRAPGNQTSLTLVGVSIDDMFFGVSAISADGFASPIVFPGAAGSFEPPSQLPSQVTGK